MKNFLIFILGVVVTILLGALGLYAYTQSDAYKKATVAPCVVDSTLVAEEVQKILNPVFVEVNDLLVFRQCDEEGFRIDSVFRSIPDETLVQVANVVLNRQGYIDKLSVVSEYRASKQIYDNLIPAPLPVQSVDNIVTETQVTDSGVPPDKSEQHTRDTMINGKKYKVTTKQEQKYEQHE